jgi:hypothetical protein
MKIQEIRGLSGMVGKLSVKTLSIPAMKGLVKLDKALTKEIQDHTELQQKLFEAYDIKPDEKEGRYVWTDHKKADEITKKVNELFSSDIEVEGFNFMTEDEFYGSVKDQFSLQEISALSDYLIKVEGPAEKPKKKSSKKGSKMTKA